MTFHAPIAAETGFLDRLLAAAGRSPAAASILHTRRGRRVVRRWRDVVAEADRYAAGFARHGLGEGKALVVEGEITPRLLIAAVAARAAGARVIAASPQANAAERAAILRRTQVAAVLVQSREAVEAWSEAAEGVAIVLDHVTAGGDGAATGVETLDGLRAAAPPRGWATRLPEAGGTPRIGPSVWVEETTAWRDGVETILDRWLDEAATLALPELLAAADRDRRDAAPAAWIVSSGRLEAAAGAFRARLPEPTTLTGRLVARALAAPSAPWARPLIGLIRRRLGLGALAAVELHEDAGAPLAPASRQWLSALGVVAAGRQRGAAPASGEAALAVAGAAS